MPTQITNEKRRFSRIEFEAPVTIHYGNERITSELVDISLKGVLIKLPKGFDATSGESMSLQIELQGMLIEMNTRLAHIEQQSMGLFCESIELDSMTNLRRLIELNLADERQLNREISEMIGHPVALT